MSWHETELRVRYEETDQGGVVYHSNYLVYFEVGRTEMLRAVGRPYRAMEESGHGLAVVEVQIRYVSPARYDDLLIVRSRPGLRRRVRFRIESQVVRADDGIVVAEGWVELACLGRDGRVMLLPSGLAELLDSGKMTAPESS